MSRKISSLSTAGITWFPTYMETFRMIYLCTGLTAYKTPAILYSYMYPIKADAKECEAERYNKQSEITL
jgi:hypothetical protein